MIPANCSRVFYVFSKLMIKLMFNKVQVQKVKVDKNR